MNALSPLVAWLLVVITLAIAAVFAVQQLRTRSWLQSQTTLSPEDQVYFRRQTVRRLVGCGLLTAVGGMIAAYYISGLDDWTNRVGEQVAAQGLEVAKQDPEVQRMKNFFRWYCIILLLLLLALVIIAAVDYRAIRAYGARHFRQIRDDRRAMLEHELAELRRGRGYRNGRSSDGPVG